MGKAKRKHQEDVAAGRAEPIRHEPKKPADPRGRYCTKCHRPIPPKEYDDHYKKCNGNPEVTCPKCGTWMGQNELPLHLATCRGK